MTTWVLLRGLGREQAHWGEFTQVLRESVPAGDTVLAVDLPGNGERWRETSPLTVEAMVDAVRLPLQAAGGSPPYALVALSLGGMVALQWAASWPAEVHCCALVNTSLGAFSPFWQRLRPSAYAALLQWMLPCSPHSRELAVYQATSNRPVDDAVLDAWSSIAQRHPVARANAARQLLAASRFRAPHGAAVPTLLLASRGDRLVSPPCSEAIARAWGLPLVEHPWAGHDLPLDDPHWLADRILQWCSTLRAA